MHSHRLHQEEQGWRGERLTEILKREVAIAEVLLGLWKLASMKKYTLLNYPGNYN